MNSLRKNPPLAFVALTVCALLSVAPVFGQPAPAQLPPAVPASTLTSPSTPEKPPNAEGFIQRWLLLEPIGVNGLTESLVQAMVKKEYFPNQLTAIPKDGDKVTVGDHELTWHAVETKLYNVNLFHFARAHGKPTSDVLFWAVTIVNCPREIRDVRLAIGPTRLPFGG